MKRRVPTHPFVADPDTPPDHNARRFCSTCYLREDHEIHDLPETTQAARERDAAVLGEKRDGE
jgi:hypothetical protein